MKLTKDEANIFLSVHTPELFAGLAEEASELAQAALKFRRATDRTAQTNNPTDKTEDECMRHLLEEAADVFLYLRVLRISPDDADIKAIMDRKTDRWVRRLGWK